MHLYGHFSSLKLEIFALLCAFLLLLCSALVLLFFWQVLGAWLKYAPACRWVVDLFCLNVLIVCFRGASFPIFKLIFGWYYIVYLDGRLGERKSRNCNSATKFVWSVLVIILCLIKWKRSLWRRHCIFSWWSAQVNRNCSFFANTKKVKTDIILGKGKYSHFLNIRTNELDFRKWHLAGFLENYLIRKK
jgi:hypothetical protein